MNAAPAHPPVRLEALDTLRGVAILGVVAFHVSIHWPPAAWIAQLAGFGNQGVQLFFLISAVTMCLMWEQRRGEAQPALRFYLRRFFRIAPLFWCAMLGYQAWPATRSVAWPPSAEGWSELALTASFLHAYAPSAINLVVPGGWSIGVEMSFYAVFPLLAAMRLAPRRQAWFAFGSYMLLGVEATTWLEPQFDDHPGFVYYSMLTQFPVFPIGILAFQLATRRERIDLRGVLLPAVCWLLLAFFGKHALGLDTRPFFWLQVMAMAAAVVLCMRRGWHWRPLSFVGTVSYSMYLAHFAVIEALVRARIVEPAAGTSLYLAFLVGTLLPTIAAAKASGSTLERWSSDLGRWVVRRTTAEGVVRPSARGRGGEFVRP